MLSALAGVTPMDLRMPAPSKLRLDISPHLVPEHGEVFGFASHLTPDRPPWYRRPWLVMSGIVALAAGLLVYVYFKDDPAPADDADLLPNFLPSRSQDNPLAAFCREMKKHDFSDWSKLPNEARELERGQEAVLQAYLDRHRAEQMLFEDLMRTDPKLWEWEGVDATLSSKTDLANLSACLPVITMLGKVEVALLERAGKQEEALKVSLQLVRFGRQLVAVDSALIHHLVAVTCYRFAVQEVKTALRDVGSEELLREAQKTLASNDLPSLALAETLQVEYLFSKNSPHLPDDATMEVMGLGGAEKVMVRLMTLPNRTSSVYSSNTRKLIEALREDWSTGFQTNETISNDLRSPYSSRWELLLKPNAGGKILLIHNNLNRSSLISRSCAAAALLRMSVVNIALRRHELAKGSTPETVDELVPHFLASVPGDPFDGKPLRWDPKRKWIYSVSEDQTDDLGKHEVAEKVGGRNPDFVMPYWWLPEPEPKPASSLPTPMRRRVPSKAP